MFENLTDSILSSIADSGKLPEKLCKYPITILKKSTSVGYRTRISEEVHFDFSQTDATSLKESGMAAKYLIKSVAETYWKYWTSQENCLTKKLLVRKVVDKGFGPRKIANMLSDYWLEYSSGPDANSNSKLEEVKKILIYIKGHPDCGVCETARIFGMSSPKFNNIRKQFELDENGKVVERKSDSKTGLNS
jgi:hypothetical protein